MSRTPTNAAFSRLLDKRSVQSKVVAVTRGPALIATAMDLGIHRTSLFLYTTGRKACPRVEALLAREFGLTVPQLRHRLKLPKLAPAELKRRAAIVLPPQGPAMPKDFEIRFNEILRAKGADAALAYADAVRNNPTRGDADAIK